MPECQPIHIINRTGGGRRDVFAASPIVFGRDPDSHVMLTGRFVSRQHGELRWEKDRWRLYVQSSNGAEINGKRVGRKGRDINDQDLVSIGQEPMFQIRFSAAPVGEPPSQDEPTAEASIDVPGKKRNRLWIGIGIYGLAVVGLFIFLATLKKGPGDGVRAAQSLTHERIEMAIRNQPLPNLPKDDRAAQTALTDARTWVNRMEVSHGRMYETYMAYRWALAHLGRNDFEDSRDQLKFLNVQDQLINRVQKLYDEAYARLKSGDYREANESFRLLTQVYPDSSSVIHDNAEAQRKVAVSRYRKKRRRGL